MRGKYKRRRLRKKFQYWENSPDKFLEDFYGIKLLQYKKIILKQMLKIVKRKEKIYEIYGK